MNHYLITLLLLRPADPVANEQQLLTEFIESRFVVIENEKEPSTVFCELSSLCDQLTGTAANPYVELSVARTGAVVPLGVLAYDASQLEKVAGKLSMAIVRHTNLLLRSGVTLASAPQPEASPDTVVQPTLRNMVLAMLLATEDSDIDYQEAASLRTAIGGEPLYQFRHADGETSYAAMQDVVDGGNPRNESDGDEDAGYIGLVPPVVGIATSGGLVTSVWVDGSPESTYFVNDSDDWMGVNWDIIDWDAIDWDTWDTEVAAAVTDQVERVVEYLWAWRKGEMSSDLLFWLIDAAPTEITDLVSHAIITIQNCDTVSDK